ncbi:MAG: PAS domain S-box protein, partial [Candidatus Thermoplasmatota archaeon]|nr:PAS domain S-box protein [Candidatus Thermoplasmatota archaeon]
EELKLKKKDGTLIWASVTATAVYDENGEVKYYDGMIEDITERREAEESLRSSQEKYQSLFEFQKGILKYSPVGILKLDERLRIVYENPEMKRLMGVPSGEESNAMGVDIRELPSVKETGAAEMFNDLLKGKEIRGEIPFTSIYGKETYLSFNAAPILEEDKFVGAVLMVTDITKKKKTGEALQESEEKYHTLVRDAAEGIYRTTIDGKILEVNPAITEMFGYSKEEFLKMKNVEIMHKNPLQRKRFLEKLQKEHMIKGYEMEYIGKDGKTLIIRESARLTEGEIIEGIMYDVTERKKAEDTLKESEEKFRLLAESSTSAIFIYQDDVFKYANPAMEKIIGYSKDDIMRMKFWNVVHPDDVRVVKERGKAREKGRKVEPYHYEFRVITKDGKTKWIDFAAANIIYEGKPAGLGTAYDVTERKRAEEALKKAYEKAEEALEQEKVFKLKTAHHFFNPIAIAKGYLDLTMDEVPEEQKKKLQSAHHAIMRVEKVVKNVTQRGEIHE